MNNRLKTLLVFSTLLLILATVSASMTCETVYNADTAPITFNKTEYEKACYKFSWNHSKVAGDFNNYVVHTTGDVEIGDFNHVEKNYTVCTVEPGDTVRIFVRPYDGNVDGHVCGFDYNAEMNTGSVNQAASYFAYALFAALAGVIGLFIILMIGLYVIKKFNIKIH